MFILWDGAQVSDLYIDGTESCAVLRAADDLARDIKSVCGVRPTAKRFLPTGEERCLVIGTLTSERFRQYLHRRSIEVEELEGEWERFLIASFGERGEHLLIAGSDERGTMWGMYEFSQRFLGIDPMYLWTGREAERRSELAIPSTRYVSDPPTFQFRGWFLNDEDLLSEWNEGGGTREIDYPFYGRIIHPHVLERVIETALRLKQNLLIPASFVDIMNPAEEALVRQVTERGLFISQHHVEPMGVSHFAWDRYWKEQGVDVAASYVREPERFEQIWTAYAARWAAYPNVIWQLGLRGRADKPVWVSDPAAPTTMEGRGKLISSALSKQYEIITRLLGHDNFYATATLWMEGTELHHAGHLHFPGKTMPIFADYGPSQMLGADFYDTTRISGCAYGVYYHVAFWPCGPHLVQGNPPEKVYFNYSNLIERGDTAYSILNVGNIREVALGVRLTAELTWNHSATRVDRFMQQWCSEQFSPQVSSDAVRLYEGLYSAYHEVKRDRVKGEVLMLDGAIKLLGLKLIDWHEDFERRTWFEDTYYAFRSYDGMIEFYTSAMRSSLRRWQALLAEARELSEHVPQARRAFFVSHFIVQIEAAIALHAWAHRLLLARKAWMRDGECDEYRAQLEDAAYALETWLLNRTKAEQGAWSGWYRGEKKLGVAELLRRTRELLATVSNP